MSDVMRWLIVGALALSGLGNIGLAVWLSLVSFQPARTVISLSPGTYDFGGRFPTIGPDTEIIGDRSIVR